MDVPDLDAMDFPDGGMWRCCGERLRYAKGCTLGQHEAGEEPLAAPTRGTAID